MLSTIQMRLKYYENIINGLKTNIELTNELQRNDIKYYIDKFISTLDFSGVTVEKVYNPYDSESRPRLILKSAGVILLNDSFESISYRCQELNTLDVIASYAYEIAESLGYKFTSEMEYSCLEDKVVAYQFAKIFLNYDVDLVECFYNLKT